ncbi:MAG TPA: SBBP repeat-containing protein [Anaeromyxobacter sp.]|nr:SBBP repeat-containing protein [Anaeromyxobacter sp.]
MRSAGSAALVLAVAGASATARAHEFQCTKQVGFVLTGEGGAPITGEDGLPVFGGPGPVGVLAVDHYPATVAFQVMVANVADAPSTLTGVVDPLDHAGVGARWGFGTALQLGVPFAVGESQAFALAFRLESYEQCLTLAAHVTGDAPVCGGTVPNLFGLEFETGYAECRADLVCLPDTPQLAWEGVKQLGSASNEVVTQLVATSDGLVHGVGWTGGGGPGLFGPVTGIFDAFHLAVDGSGAVVHGNQVAAFERFGSLAFDALGNALVAAHADSDGSHVVAQSALAKLSPADDVLWTELAGAWVADVGVDAAGGIYVTGMTEGSLYGVAPPVERTAFLLRLTPDRTLDWVRFFDAFSGHSLDVGPSGAGWVVGTGFVAWFDALGDVLHAAPFGADASIGLVRVALAVDGGAYAVGTHFPGGSTDAVVARYSASRTLHWTRHVGNGAARASALAVDAFGGVWIAGSLRGALPGQAGAGSEDAFVAKLTPAGELVFATQLGTSADDAGTAVAVDLLGNGYVAGWTDGGAFPGHTRPPEFVGDLDVFIAKVSPQGVIQ